MNTNTQAHYLSSLEALQRLAKERARFPGVPQPGTLADRQYQHENRRAVALWAEFCAAARQYPQEDRRAAA